MADAAISVRGVVETIGILATEPPCLPPGSACAPSAEYWAKIGTITIGTPAPTSLPDTSVLTSGDYFIGAYLPTLVAVLIATPMTIIAFRCRQFEPFYQLARSEGATAYHSLCVDYSSAIPSKTLFTALVRGHWVLVLTSALLFSASLLAPLASETIFIGLTGSCTSSDAGSKCGATLSVSPVVARVTEALLGIMAVLTLLVIVATHKRYFTGFSDPRSIAGLATLFQRPDVLEDFRRARLFSSNKEFHKNIASYRYRITHYQDDDGIQSLGLVRLGGSHHSETQIMLAEHSVHNAGFAESPDYGQERTDVPTKVSDNKSSLWPRYVSIATFAAILSGLLSLIVYYRKVQAPSGFETFMDSQGFGVRFLFTLTGVLVKTFWDRLFRGT
jgi:hypothetical protein